MRKFIVLTILLLVFFAGQLDAATRSVAPGESIQDAIDYVSANGGGIVTLAGGIHQIDTSIKMKSNITLSGEGSAVTTINTSKVIKSIEQASEGLENVTIQNLNITGVAVNGSHAIHIISNKTDHTNIKLLNVHASNTGWGVHIKGAQDVTIKNCEFTKNGAKGKEGYAHNLYLRRCKNAIVSNTKLIGSTTGNGCNISYSENITLDNCEVLNNFYRGIRAANSDGYTVTNCKIGGNGRVGLLANSESAATKNIKFDNNIVFNNGEGGIRAINGVTGSVTNCISFGNKKFDFDLPGTVKQNGNSSEEPAATKQAPQNAEEKWTIRFNQSSAQELFVTSTSQAGFTFKTSKIDPETEDLYVYYHLSLGKPINGLTFDYDLTGDAALMQITLFDAAANELWRFDGHGDTPQKVALKDLKVHGQIIFRIRRNQSAALAEGWSHSVSNIKLTADTQKPIFDKDGFILVDNITEFRGYVGQDNVKVRLKPGPYQIDKALCTRFIEVTGNNSYYDLNGARFMVDTNLFSRSDVAKGIGEKSLYCAIEISGNNNTMEGLYIETYGDGHGIQSKNKMFNISGSGVTLKNAEVRTAGSVPWGYGSFYGLGGVDVRKMNGIRVGSPAKNVKLIGCRVHMRAMGHAIFVQGADNTLIEDCHVDGLLRTTDDILAETSGYAFDKNFKAAKGGYIEGVTVAKDGTFLPGEMYSLSEDGIRMYPDNSPGPDTGSTTVKDCTVTNMRRGICTGLSAAGDMVINCQVNNCVATGFNVGGSDTLINCRADAKYAEAVCLPYGNAHNAKVELEILDSRGSMKNTLLAKINGTGHQVNIRTSNPSYIPDDMVIKLSTTEGYGGPGRLAAPGAVDIQLTNQTPAKIMLLPGTVNPQIESKGGVENQAGTAVSGAVVQ